MEPFRTRCAGPRRATLHKFNDFSMLYGTVGWARTTDLLFHRRKVKIRPHQFRTRNSAIESPRMRLNPNENAAKSTKAIDILPLITVWLQVRLLSEPTTKTIAKPCLWSRWALASSIGESAFAVRAGCAHRPQRRKIRQSKIAGGFSPFCSPWHSIVR